MNMVPKNQKLRLKESLMLRSPANKEVSPFQKLPLIKTIASLSPINHTKKDTGLCKCFEFPTNYLNAQSTNTLGDTPKSDKEESGTNPYLVSSSSEFQLPKLKALLKKKEKIFAAYKLKEASVLNPHSFLAPLKRKEESKDMEVFKESIRVKWQKQRIFKSIYNKNRLLI